MKIPNSRLLDYNGNPIKEGEKEFFVKDAILGVINVEDQEHRLLPEQKSMAFQIGVKVSGAKDVIELTIDEAKYVKDRSSIYHNPLIYGRLCEALDKENK